jgi:hypothetical protein
VQPSDPKHASAHNGHAGSHKNEHELTELDIEWAPVPSIPGMGR